MKSITGLCFVIFLFLFGSWGMAEQEIEEVTIYRDSYGVAHIQAPSMEALFTAWGYTTAQDRLFTLETLKMASQGRVAEMFGPGDDNMFVEFDKLQRMISVPEKGELQKEINALPRKYRILLEAYARGINMRIDEVLGNPDQLLHYAFVYHGITTIEHWTDWDVAQTFNWAFSTSWLNGINPEMINLSIFSHLVTTFGEDNAQKMMDDMMPTNVPDVLPTIPGYSTTSSAKAVSAKKKVRLTINKGLKEAMNRALYQDEIKRKVFNELGFPLKEGSYMFLVGGEKTEGNDSFCFGGPQSGFFYPSRFYETGLHCPGMDVVGMSTFGMPIILMGSNKDVAYNATSTFGNVMDIFLLDLSGDDYHYTHNGKRKKMKKRKTVIRVKGGEAIDFDLYSSVYGPVVAWGEGVAFTHQYSWTGQALNNFVAIIKHMKADSVSDFIEACSDINTAVNYGVADNQGNFGYVYCGITPKTHPDVDLRLPTPGTGEYDWRGYYPFSWNPKSINHPQGYLVNWNNMPTADAFKFREGWLGFWNTYNRIFFLDELMAKADKITVEDAKAMIKRITTVNRHGYYLLPYFEAAMKDETDQRLLSAMETLRTWGKLNMDDDYDGNYDGSGYTIWKAWLEKVFTNAFADELGPHFSLTDAFFIYNAFLPNMVIHHLEGDQSAVPIQYQGWLNGKTMKQVIRESLEDTLDDLESQFSGIGMDNWLTPVTPLVFIPGFFPGVPGGSVGVRDVHVHMDRGTYDQVIRFSGGRIAESENLSAPGTSGFVSPAGVPSPYFDDQIDLFEDFNGFKKMHVYLDDAIKAAKSVKKLRVKVKK